ncbi:MAG: hypothetical protein NVSMB64_29970 [Candidatus Velthaea sp.]
MHEERPSQVEGEYQPPLPENQRPSSQSRWKNAGGAAVGAGLLLAKFKTALAFLLSLKWIFLGGKFALSFGSIFASIWFYALLFGWKLGIVFVLLVLVHEMGHWLSFRAMGVPVSLPYFIPGFAAFVQAKAAPPTPAHGAVAALMGPVLGIAAAAICYGYGITTDNKFWFAAAYIGFFLNLINLIPFSIFDGAKVAEVIDPRLFWLGVLLFGFVIAMIGLHTPMAWLWLGLIGVAGIPRLRMAWRGEIPPQFTLTPVGVRRSIAAGYFATIAIAAAGAGVTMLQR